MSHLILYVSQTRIKFFQKFYRGNVRTLLLPLWNQTGCQATGIACPIANRVTQLGDEGSCKFIIERAKNDGVLAEE